MLRRAGINAKAEDVNPASPVLDEIVGQTAELQEVWSMPEPEQQKRKGRGRGRGRGHGGHGYSGVRKSERKAESRVELKSERKTERKSIRERVSSRGRGHNNMSKSVKRPKLRNRV